MSEETKKSPVRSLKYYAIVQMGRIHFIALGRHKNIEVATEVANSFIVRNTREDMVPAVLGVIDEWEMRSFLGEVIKPIYGGPEKKQKSASRPEMEVESEEDDTPVALPVTTAPVVDTNNPPAQPEHTEIMWEITGHAGVA